MNENIDHIINKLVQNDFKLLELEEIAPYIGSSEFKLDYSLAEDMKTIIVNEAREEMKTKIRNIIKEEKASNKRDNVINMQTLGLKAIAACFLIVCTVGVLYTTTSYNNEKHFSKPITNK